MMDVTDRHFRRALRAVTRRTLLYTEMVTTAALLRGNCERHLAHDPCERPLALQLGGDDPGELAECARIAEDWGFAEVNLNVGCPSDRVQRGRFGACLMAHPQRVADCVEAMRRAVALPVTVKHRIGIDDRDRYEDMAHFVAVVSAAGADRFTVHARKAWLSGLSPKQNRTVPPLRYDDVYRLKAEFPHLEVELNGGVRSLDAAAAHLERVDAVMIGRAAQDDPYLFAEADRRFFGDPSPPPSREEVVERLLPYVAQQLAAGARLQHLARPLLGLFAGQPGARRWRRQLSEGAQDPRAGVEVLERALSDRRRWTA
ncbi:MAG: tRNA dihydrouridine(20/20a) synthase DusA [Planctomycetota bacterium]|nr:MAG: tRNA dihydrouridine(20/20a) synthase DusA [Planctomycetota bacterium]